MQYPLISEYVRAIQNAGDNLGELAHLVPVFDNHGEPYRSSGAFVYLNLSLRTIRKQSLLRHGFYIGKKYYYGIGVEQNYEEAVKWYRKSAELGESRIQNNLGNCYLTGHGVEQSYEEAVMLYRKAAKQGYATAQSKLENIRR